MASQFIALLFQNAQFYRLHFNQTPPEPSHLQSSLHHVSSTPPGASISGRVEHFQSYCDIDHPSPKMIGADSNSTDSVSDQPDAADWLVFFTLETLGVSGLIGNIVLLAVIISSGLLERPSFIFITSLAVADLLHSTVTSCYFYPPIVLRQNPFSRMGIQIMNALDWTAWGVTLSHMMAICTDRLLAIVVYQDYVHLVTSKRTMVISLLCWVSFASVNTIFTSLQLCCVVVPQPEFYTFGFEDSSMSQTHSQSNTSAGTNVYKPLYVPLECLAMLILAIGNPIILFNLYEKYRRKRNLRAASVVLVEVGESLCRQQMGMDASLARDLKIFLQIIVVTVIFFAYMFIYYLFFYITEFSDKWSTMLNSICYSITHMINPIVYFSLNEQMQRHVSDMIYSVGFLKRRKAVQAGRRNALCGVSSIVHALSIATAALAIEKENSGTSGQLQMIEEEERPRLWVNVNMEEETERRCAMLSPLIEEGSLSECQSTPSPLTEQPSVTCTTYYFGVHPADTDVFL